MATSGADPARVGVRRRELRKQSRQRRPRRRHHLPGASVGHLVPVDEHPPDDGLALTPGPAASVVECFVGSMNGQVAIVTGASRGIGQRISERFAAEGALAATF